MVRVQDAPLHGLSVKSVLWSIGQRTTQKKKLNKISWKNEIGVSKKKEEEMKIKMKAVKIID